MRHLRLTVGAAAWLYATAAMAQEAMAAAVADTVEALPTVEVTALRRGETIPAQRLGGQELERLGSHSVADALRYFSGLQLKDYGGVGGLKTVNIRSMGSQHLGVFYDGVELGNAQNGQIDLGQLSLDNVEEIALYQGQKSAIFQPASDFVHAGSVYIRTKVPTFGGERSHLRLRGGIASSDTWRLATLWEQRLSPSVSGSMSGRVLTSSGRYKFRYRRLNMDRTVAYDTTATRQNGAIEALRLEGNLHGRLAGGSWNAKAYTYHSSRGIPGAIVNNVWRRGEHQDDHNTFLQVHLQKAITAHMATQLTAKYAYYGTHYANNDTTQLRVDNHYRQQECYLSAATMADLLPCWSVSGSYDFRWNRLDADTRQFVRPMRHTHIAAMATAFDLKWLAVQASLAYEGVRTRSKEQGSPTPDPSPKGGAKGGEWTPAVYARLHLLRIPSPSGKGTGEGLLALRAYAKRSFRMPTFNDLYYTEIGNALLRPETALQYNIGVAYDHAIARGWWRQLHVQADLYHNSVHDKIVAYPKGQQFRWTMLNLGRVHIDGLDIEADTRLAPLPHLAVTLRLQYTYQDARDVTNPADAYYHDQIPYIPWHSGSAIVQVSYKRWDANYSFIYAGERYSQQENIAYNHLQPWYTSDMSVGYRWGKQGHAEWRATLQVNNLFSQDYDVILNYPMPKRNYAVTVEVRM